MLPCHRGRVLIAVVLLVLLGSGARPLFGEGEAEALSASFRQAARRSLPAVVSVRTIGGVPGPFPLRAFPLPGGTGPGAFPNEPGGSGVVIDAGKGFVLTNDHVVQGASRVVVVLHDGHERAVEQVRRDPRSSLALLILSDAKGLTQAEWGDSDALDLGDWVLAVGHTFGLSNMVTAGIVSGKGRGAGLGLYEDLIQTDAAISLGNSGGPLVNLKGQVVGITLAISTGISGVEGVNFAVPASRARRVAADLAERGTVRRAFLGIQIGPVDRATAERLDQPGAVAVNVVTPDSPAAAAGLRRGDVIVSLEGKPVGSPGAFQAAVEVAPVGEPLTLTIDRDGERREVKVTPKELPETLSLPDLPGPRPLRRFRGGPPLPELIPPPDAATILKPKFPGATTIPELGADLIEGRLTIPSPGGREVIEGLAIVDVEPESAADRAGLEKGMYLTDVAGRRVKTIEDLRAALADRPQREELEVRARLSKGGKAEFRVRPDVTERKPKPEPAKEKDEPSP